MFDRPRPMPETARAFRECLGAKGTDTMDASCAGVIRRFAALEQRVVEIEQRCPEETWGTGEGLRKHLGLTKEEMVAWFERLPAPPPRAPKAPGADE